MLRVAFYILLGAAMLVRAADSTDMLNFLMGVLNKNGEQTSCMIAIMDMKSAFVAANCIDLTSDNKVNTTTTYQVRLTSFTDSVGQEIDLNPSDITIHPNYNSTTLANNIAIIQYNKNTTDDYVSFITTDDYVGTTEVYVRRSFNEPTGNWNPPTVDNEQADDGNCAAASALYAANINLITCTSATTTSTENSNCSMPYAQMYRENSTDAIVSANLYSHSVVYGTNMCNGPVTTFSYYTKLWTYAGFASGVLNRPISVFGQLTNTTYSDTTINSMIAPSTVSVSGAMVVGGDLYPVQRDMADGSSSATEPVSSGELSSSEVSESSTLSGGGTGGLTKGGKIAVGVAVPLGVILIALVSICVYRMWTNKQKEKDWNPEMEETQLRTAALELNIEDVLVTPPPYSTSVGGAIAAAPRNSDVVDSNQSSAKEANAKA